MRERGGEESEACRFGGGVTTKQLDATPPKALTQKGIEMQVDVGTFSLSLLLLCLSSARAFPLHHHDGASTLSAGARNVSCVVLQIANERPGVVP